MGINASDVAAATRFVIQRRPRSSPDLEICEHKGIGHPDSICDGVAEAVSSALCRAYIRDYGQVQHYNVDKALLVGGESAPRFSGGRLLQRPRLIVCGRAAALANEPVDALVRFAATEYLAAQLHCDPDIFVIESAVRSGSPNLQRVIGSARLRSNDTSFGAGYAPYSDLERTVLRLAAMLRSAEFRSAFPAAGDDYKLMAMRTAEGSQITAALAFIDHHVASVAAYFVLKDAMIGWLTRAADLDCALVVNALDDSAAKSEVGLYLSTTGLSAEHGDDGQVGRGNRVNGLITPLHTMSLEAAAGKNSVAHVGKLYNVIAFEMAQAIVAQVAEVAEASVQILSVIGRPVDEPALVAVTVTPNAPDVDVANDVATICREQLGTIGALSERIIAGAVRVF